jgi:hypothetical protein
MNDKYLGMPVHVGQCRTKVFEYLKGRIWNRIQGWKEKTILGRKRSPNKSSGSSNSHLRYGMF